MIQPNWSTACPLILIPTESCPLETLHAVSALGTKLCFYSINTRDDNATIDPLAIPQNPMRVNDPAPANRWDSDILEAAGEERFRQIVEEINVGCAALV